MRKDKSLLVHGPGSVNLSEEVSSTSDRLFLSVIPTMKDVSVAPPTLCCQ